MSVRILTSVIGLLHSFIFFLMIVGGGFGVALGELSAKSEWASAVVMGGLGVACLVFSALSYFAPVIAGAGLVFVLGGLAAGGLWAFVLSGFSRPISLAFFLVEILLAGIPYALFRME